MRKSSFQKSRTHIRFKGVTFGFPVFTVHYDEHYIVDPALEIIKSEEFNPSFFNYPSFYIYAQSFVYSSVFHLGKILGYYESINDVEKTTIYFFGRLLTVFFSVATIFFVFLISKKIYNFYAGFFSLLFISVSFLHIRNSFCITPNSPMTFWVVLAFYIAVLLYYKPKLLYYLLGGAFVGIAIGTKYLAFLIYLPLLYSHFHNNGFKLKSKLNIYLLASTAAVSVAFFITTPFSIIDFNTFYSDIKAEQSHYARGHVGSSLYGNSYCYYLNVLVKEYGLFQLILSGVGLLLLSIKRKWKSLLIALFPVAYFLFVGHYRTHFSRNAVVLIPFLSLMSGICIADIIEKAKNAQAIHRCRLMIKKRKLTLSAKCLKTAFIILVLLSAIAASIYGSYKQGNRALSHVKKITLPNTMMVAAKWIENNISAGRTIAIEHYTPRPDEKKYRVIKLGKYGLIRKPHAIKKADYFVTSSSDYGRFFKDKKIYKKQRDEYQIIFRKYKLVKEFVADNRNYSGPIIKIFKSR